MALPLCGGAFCFYQPNIGCPRKPIKHPYLRTINQGENDDA